MDANPDYTGTHKVVLPVGYINSIEAVCELYEDQIAAVAANLNCLGLRLSTTRRLLRFTVARLGIWLIQGI